MPRLRQQVSIFQTLTFNIRVRPVQVRVTARMLVAVRLCAVGGESDLRAAGVD